MKKIFKRIISKNIPENASIRERKTSVLSNLLILFVLSMTLLITGFIEFSTNFGFSEHEGAVLNGVFFLLYLVCFYINQKGLFFLGKTIFLIILNLHTIGNYLSFGPYSGSNLYFMIGFILPFLLFASDKMKYIYLFMLIPIVSIVCCTIYFSNHEPFIKLNPEQITFWNYSNTTIMYVILGGCIYTFFNSTHEAEEMFTLEKQKSEDLLLNILPEPIAKRLKSGESNIADHYENVSVLFSDIVGFTKYSQTVSAHKLVSVLNDLFSEFDNLSIEHRLEKIKTIGDAYMVVSGVPESDGKHAEKIIQMAIDMRDALEKWKERQNINLEIRIGIHSGDVIAGVIGKRKFIYDIWGDAVNTASRMESHGLPGRIQVSETTFELCKDKFTFEERGEISIKGKNNMKTYLLLDGNKVF